MNLQDTGRQTFFPWAEFQPDLAIPPENYKPQQPPAFAEESAHDPSTH